MVNNYRTPNEYTTPRSWLLVFTNFICCAIYMLLTNTCNPVVPMVHMYCTMIYFTLYCLAGQFIGNLLPEEGDIAVILFCLFMISMHFL